MHFQGVIHEWEDPNLCKIFMMILGANVVYHIILGINTGIWGAPFSDEPSVSATGRGTAFASQVGGRIVLPSPSISHPN